MIFFNRKQRKPCGCWAKVTAHSVITVYRCETHLAEWRSRDD